MNYSQLAKDLYCVKALVYMDDGIKWYRCNLLGINERGEAHVRRIRTGQEGVTTQFRNLSDSDREHLRENYL